MELEKIYKQLTGVDIAKQKEIWDERGKGYYGEYLVFCELYKNIAGDGKILMNVRLPVSSTKTTEIDLIMIHKTGIYVFEIKHYKGRIYGNTNDNHWTQFFITTKNNVILSPAKQNEYHIEALKKIYPNVPMHSAVVFTRNDCELIIKNNNPNLDICCLQDLKSRLNARYQRATYEMSMNEIDNIFSALLVFSPMRDIPNIKTDINTYYDTSASFYSWIHPLIEGLKEKNIELQNAIIENNVKRDAVLAELTKERERVLEKEKNIQKKSRNMNRDSLLIMVICAAISLTFMYVYTKDYNQKHEVKVAQIENNCEKKIEEIEKENELLKRKFLHINDVNNPYIDTLQSYVSVSNVILEPLTDDAVNFTATITNKVADTYMFNITSGAKIIVHTHSGKIFEYDYAGGKFISYGSYKLDTKQLYGVSNINDVRYIKITGISIYSRSPYKNLVNELEIELYSN